MCVYTGNGVGAGARYIALRLSCVMAESGAAFHPARHEKKRRSAPRFARSKMMLPDLGEKTLLKVRHLPPKVPAARWLEDANMGAA